MNKPAPKPVMISDEVMELQKLFYQTHDYTREQAKGRILVLGIGNYLMGDEGVGVHAVQALSKVPLPEGVDIMDGGTGSFDLMPVMAQYPLVILIDATMDGRPPGTVEVLRPRFSADFPLVLSAHDVGLKDMIEALEFKGELPEIILITVSIAGMKPMDITLSDEVKKSLPEVVRRVKALVKESIIK